MSRMRQLVLFTFFLLLMVVPGCHRDDADHSYVQDPAGVLSALQRQRLQRFQQLLNEEQDIHFLLLILDRKAADLDSLALELFEQNALGADTVGARGLLLVVDPFSQQARIEVGYDLEGVFPDGFIAGLEYDQMLPFFQQDRIGHGVEALTELLVARLSAEEADAATKDGQVMENGYLSGGGGARISTSGSSSPVLPANREYLPQVTPLASLAVYQQVLRDRVKDPELEIYTPQSRRFFRDWLVTDAQQQNALSDLDEALPHAEVMIQERLAVIRFPVENRHAAPYYLRLGGQGWQLDFAEMNRTIGFNHRNQWHFLDRQHDYNFAFADWRFDQHGFPHQARKGN